MNPSRYTFLPPEKLSKKLKQAMTIKHMMVEQTRKFIIDEGKDGKLWWIQINIVDICTLIPSDQGLWGIYWKAGHHCQPLKWGKFYSNYLFDNFEWLISSVVSLKAGVNL